MSEEDVARAQYEEAYRVQYQQSTAPLIPAPTPPSPPARVSPKTWLGQLLGELYSAQSRFEKEKWHSAIDACFPDWWPLIAVQDVFFNILNWVFDPKIDHDWNTGVEAGDRTWNETLGKFEEAKRVVTDYVNQKKEEIDRAIANANTKITGVATQAEDALTRARNALDSATSALSIANNSSVKAVFASSQAQSALDQVNQALSLVDTLKSRITTAETDLGVHEGKIADLITRVKSLEGSSQTQKSLLDRLLGK